MLPQTWDQSQEEPEWGSLFRRQVRSVMWTVVMPAGLRDRELG